MTKQVLEGVFAAIGKIVAIGGGGAVVAYGLFNWLGKSWLDQHFKKQLEQLKHDQQKEVEQFRYQINSLFSRISKIHEKEFEVLPEAWRLLNESHGSAFQVVAAVKTKPNFNQMIDSHLDDFLKASRLPEYQKQELLKATDRNQYYTDAIFWLEMSDAEAAWVKLNNYLAVNSIFMTQDLREKFQFIDSDLQTVLRERKLGQQSRDHELINSSSETFNRLAAIFRSIESAVQQRLHYNEA